MTTLCRLWINYETITLMRHDTGQALQNPQLTAAWEHSTNGWGEHGIAGWVRAWTGGWAECCAGSWTEAWGETVCWDIIPHSERAGDKQSPFPPFFFFFFLFFFLSSLFFQSHSNCQEPFATSWGILIFSINRCLPTCLYVCVPVNASKSGRKLHP